MPALTLLTGKVTHVSNYIRLSHAAGDGSYLRQTTMFRVDGTPVRFQAAINIADGDTVTVSGRQAWNGEFNGLAMRNESTGASYGAADGVLAACAGAMFLLFGIAVRGLSATAAEGFHRFPTPGLEPDFGMPFSMFSVFPFAVGGCLAAWGIWRLLLVRSAARLVADGCAAPAVK